jgi:hypothetical protein
VDRAAAMIYERWQLWRRTYGIVVYVARKPTRPRGRAEDAGAGRCGDA